MSQLNIKALQQIDALSRQFGFKVYIANAPIYEKLWESKKFRTYFKRLDDALSDYAASSDRIHYIMTPPALFPSHELATGTDHLTLSGAEKYSRQLAKQIMSEKTR